MTPKSTLLGYCGHCTGCTRVVANTHPDLYIAHGQLKIGDRDGSGFHETEETTARDIVRQLSLHSYAGGKRVFILGDADFTREAANALLKFFEEPPAGVLLIDGFGWTIAICEEVEVVNVASAPAPVPERLEAMRR